MNRDKFMFFDNFKETADRLPDDLRLKFYDAMTDYVFKGVEPDDAIISALITAIKPSLDKEDKRGGNHNPLGQNQYSEVKKEVKEVKNGQSGQSFLETETETENNLNPKNKTSNEVIVLSPYKGDEKCSCCERRAKFDVGGVKFCGQHTRIKLSEMGRLDLLPESQRFVKPTFDEVEAYCKERGNGVDADRFISYYEANGWKVGRNPMKDWRAAVRTWERGSESVRPAVTVANDIITRSPEEEEQSRRTQAIIEATMRANEERVKARFGI